MTKSRSFAFTINNYDETILESLRESLSQEKVRYAIFGHEVGQNGTPHLQGYLSLKAPLAVQSAKRDYLVPTAHIEVAKASEHKNRKYCSKDGKVEEFGRPSQQGTRSDLVEFQEAVKAGNLNPKRLREEFPEVCAKYPRFVSEYIRDQIPEPEIPCHALNEWQQELNQKLIHEPDDRKVIFVVDQKGNKGKSWFAKYYCKLHDNAFLMRPGKHADMSYMLPPTLRVLFLDCTRKQVEYMPYTFMEELKDGYVSCTKYESCVKKYEKVHVVVLMNQEPDITALSEDRYEYIYP